MSDIERNGLLDKGYLKLFTWCLCPVPAPAPERRLVMVSRFAPAPTQPLVFLQCCQGTRRGWWDVSSQGSWSPSCKVSLGEDFGLNSAFHYFCGSKLDPYSVVGTQIWATLLILVTCCASEHLPASLLCSENAGIVHLNYNLAVIIRLYWFNKMSCLFCFRFNISKKERLTIRNINILDFTYLVAWRRLKKV